jgi:hypothetical protein
VNCDLIVEGDNSKITPAEVRNHGPKSVAVVLLTLNPHRIPDDGNTPFALEIRALAEDFFLEVLGETKLDHFGNLVPPDRGRCR